MLPNLSALRLLPAAADIDAIADEQRKKRIAERQARSNKARRDKIMELREDELQMDEKPSAIDWAAVIENSLKAKDSRVRFKVTSVIDEDSVQEMTFTLIQAPPVLKLLLGNIYGLTGPGAVCAEVTLTPTLSEEYPATLHVDNLFYGLSKKTAEECDMEPSREEATNAGQMVLRFVEEMAMDLGAFVTLDDASNFKEAVGANFSGMTRTLRAKRGFGYYERRGYFNSSFYDGYEDRLLTHLVLAQTVQLHWTHMLMTTPLGKLQARIDSFASEMTPELFAGNAALTSLYQKSGAGPFNHNDLAQPLATYVQYSAANTSTSTAELSALLQFVKSRLFFYKDLQQILTVKSSEQLSLRQIAHLLDLCHAVTEASGIELNKRIAKFLSRFETFGDEGVELYKRIHDIDGAAFELVVDADPMDPSGPAVCVLQPFEPTLAIEML